MKLLDKLFGRTHTAQPEDSSARKPGSSLSRQAAPAGTGDIQSSGSPSSDPESARDETGRIRALIARLERKDRALEANDELAKCGKAAVPEMLAGLANKSLQGWLVPLLGRTGDRRAMEPLRALVASGDGPIRSHAAAALGKLGIPDPAAITTLVAALDDDIARLNSIYALNDLDPAPAREALARLANTTEDVSLAAACKAVFLRLDGDIEGLARMMKDDTYQVGCAAVGIIKATNNERVRAILAEAARSAPQELVRMEARFTLAHLNEALASTGSATADPHSRLASNSPGERRDAAQALAYGLDSSHDAKRDVDALLKALSDSDPEVRAVTRAALIESRNAISLLVDAYRASVASDPVRACLAGRVLGTKMTGDLGTDMIEARLCQIMYGLDVAFVSCVCGACGAVNKGIPVPPRGPMIPYYGQEGDNGAYAVPVLCDRCGVVFHVAWDSDPR
jgi:HEAT repeat protein